MTDAMKKQLDDMLAGAEPAQASEQATEKPPEPTEHDPLAHLIGNTDPNADRDPFSLMLDGMLEQEGMSKETETPGYKTEGFEEHEWEFKSELVYEEDDAIAICKKCFRQMRVTRQQTWNEGILAHGIDPDCGQGIATDVMDA